MGVCESQIRKAQKVRSKKIQKIILFLSQCPTQELPDIYHIVLTTLTRFDIEDQQLQIETITGIYNFLSSLNNLNEQQYELFSNFKIVYEQSIQNFRSQNSFLYKQILMTTIEVFLCIKCLRNENLQPVDIWWVEEYFQFRYIQLKQEYQVDYNSKYIQKNYLIQFLYLIQLCIIKDQNLLSLNQTLQNIESNPFSKQITMLSKNYYVGEEIQ